MLSVGRRRPGRLATGWECHAEPDAYLYRREHVDPDQDSVWQKEDSAHTPKADGLASAHGLPSGNFWADIYNMK
jgi:hypothetical protein